MMNSVVTPRRLLLVALFVSLAAGGAQADTGSAITTSLLYQSWSLDTDDGALDFGQTVTEVKFKFMGRSSPLSLRGYVPIFWTDDQEADASLSGLGDAQIRLQWKRPHSALKLIAGADLPTGQTGLSEEEARVAARAMASRVLDLRLKRPGEGLDLFGGASLGTSLGRNTALGFAAAANLKQAYDLYEASDGTMVEANPGERLHLSLSLLAREHDEDPNWDFKATLGAQAASATSITQGEASSEISEGAQLTFDAAYGRRVGEGQRLALTIFVLARDRSTSDDAQIVAEEVLGISTRSVTELGLSYARPMLGMAGVFALTQTAYRMDPSQGVNSRMTMLKAMLGKRLSGRIHLDGQIGYGFGRTPWASDATSDAWEKRSLNSLQFGLQMRYDFVPQS